MLNAGLFRTLKPQSAKQIFFISMGALLLGHLMINTYISNEGINLVGLLITSVFVYHFTLRKSDFYSFVMVIYFCSTFPYLSAKGGGFNLVSFICIIFYFFNHKYFIVEKKLKDFWSTKLIILLVISSLLGWFFNYTGKGMDFLYSFLTFFGVILLLIVSSRLELTAERIKVFLQLNFILIIYSTLASLNKYVHLITFNTPMMPIYGKEDGYFEGGGLIGSSPSYGEHSLILLVLFAVFLIIKNKVAVKKSTLILGVFISLINVFMSISRSVFMLALVGIAIILLLQFRINPIKLHHLFAQIFALLLFGFLVITVVNETGLNYVFDRMDEIEQKNQRSGGITIDRIIDGSAFNREIAFAEAQKRYRSRDSWLVGFGWGLAKNNRDAFYVDIKINRATAHTQIYAILFIFGWIGFTAYWGLLLWVIFKSYRASGNKNFDNINRVMAYFSMIGLALFAFNEIKADSISFPYYFAVTIIWMGMAISAANPNKLNFITENNQGYGH